MATGRRWTLRSSLVTFCSPTGRFPCRRPRRRTTSRGAGLERGSVKIISPSEPKSSVDRRCLGSTKEVSRFSKRWGYGGLTARRERGSSSIATSARLDNAAARQAIAAFNKGEGAGEGSRASAVGAAEFFHRESRGSGRGCWKEAAMLCGKGLVSWCVCCSCIPVLLYESLFNSFAGFVVRLVRVSLSFVLIFYFLFFSTPLVDYPRCL